MAMAELHQSPVTAYGELLRPIGAFLDSAQAQDVVLAEIQGGFTWTYRVRGSSAAARSATIDYDNLPRLREQVRRGKQAPATLAVESADLVTLPSNVLPMHALGYQEKFRSLGAKLDLQHAEQIQIVEAGAALMVRYVVTPPGFVRRAQRFEAESLRFREDTYDPCEIGALISQSRSRRGSKYYY